MDFIFVATDPILKYDFWSFILKFTKSFLVNDEENNYERELYW